MILLSFACLSFPFLSPSDASHAGSIKLCSSKALRLLYETLLERRIGLSEFVIFSSVYLIFTDVASIQLVVCRYKFTAMFCLKCPKVLSEICPTWDKKGLS